MQFPAKTLVRFFRNHALACGQWQASVVDSQGRQRGICAPACRLRLRMRGAAEIHTGTPVTGMSGVGPFGVSDLQTRSRTPCRMFDDDHLCLPFGSGAGKSLGRMAHRHPKPPRFPVNPVSAQYGGAALRPKPRCRSAAQLLVKLVLSVSQEGAIGVTYWMNRLQGYSRTAIRCFVSLNPTRRPIPADKIYDTAEFSHPVFDARRPCGRRSSIRRDAGRRTGPGLQAPGTGMDFTKTGLPVPCGWFAS